MTAWIGNNSRMDGDTAERGGVGVRWGWGGVGWGGFSQSAQQLYNINELGKVRMGFGRRFPIVMDSKI